MKVTNKMHRVASILSAVVMLLGWIILTVVSVVGMITSGTFNAFTIVRNTLATIPVIIVLLCGKKDLAAGIVIILTALVALAPSLYSQIRNIIYCITEGSSKFYSEGMYSCALSAALINVVGVLISGAFRVALAVECFLPGKLSGSKAKALLILLPIVAMIVAVIGTAVSQLYVIADFGMVQFVTMTVASAVFQLSIDWILVGITFAIPVCEKEQTIQNM